jgi:hypothetical protein
MNLQNVWVPYDIAADAVQDARRGGGGRSEEPAGTDPARPRLREIPKMESGSC